MIGPGPDLSFYNEEDEEIGSGSFGRVFKCTLKVRKNAELDEMRNKYPEEMAIKVLIKSDHNKNLKRETEFCNDLKHKNIITFFGVDHDRFNVYIKMEQADMSLSKYQDNRNNEPIHMFELDNVGSQIAEGLIYLHENNITHRDLKPSNILLFLSLSNKGTPPIKSLRYANIKLCDFGLSRYLEKFSESQTVVGTRQYMAPEVAKVDQNGQKMAMGSKLSDIFSAGVIIFELLTGHLPYTWEELVHEEKKSIFEIETSKMINKFKLPLTDMLMWKAEERISAFELAECFRNSVSKMYVGFHMACINGCIEELQQHFGATTYIDPQFPDHRSVTPFLMACCEGHLTVAQYLIENGANINQTDPNGWTALHFTCLAGHLEISKFLIERGAKINIAGKYGLTPLHIACLRGHLQVFEFLIERGANISVVSSNGTTPLFGAAKEGHLSVAKILIEKGNEIDKANRIQTTPLYIACEKGHLEVGKFLISKGAQIDKANTGGWIPLHIACAENHLMVVKMLIENGAEINRGCQNRSTPLHLACQNGHFEICQFLIANGADIDKENANGWTPLHSAFEKGHIVIAEMLLSKGADKNKANCNGYTPFDVAEQNSHLSVCDVISASK